MPLCGSHFISEIPDLVCNKNLQCEDRESIMKELSEEQNAEHTRIAPNYDKTFTEAKKILEEFLQRQPEESKLQREAEIPMANQE